MALIHTHTRKTGQGREEGEEDRTDCVYVVHWFYRKTDGRTHEH